MPRLATLSSIPILLLAAAPAAAQPYVVPRALDGVEANSSSLIPFGFGQAARIQLIYNADQFAFGPGTRLQRLRLRPDHVPNTPVPGKRYVYVTVIVSTTGTTAETVSRDFDANHGSDRTVVLPSTPVIVPSGPAAAAGPHPFGSGIDLPFARPWTFGNTPLAGSTRPANLCIEIQVSRQSGEPYEIDVPQGCTSQVTSFGQLGPLCVGSGGAPVVLTSNDSVLAGGVISYTATGLPANAGLSLALNVVPRATPLDLTAPPLFDRLPAWDCFLLVDPLFSLSATADRNGVARASFRLPRDLSYVGGALYAQALALDNVNPLGVVTSQGLRTTVCGPLGIAQVFSLAGAGAGQGQVLFGSAPIVELQ